MSKEKELMNELLGAVGDEEEAEPETAFGLALRTALGSAVAYMRGEGVIEMEDHHVEALVAELTTVGVDARSPRQMLNRLSRTLVESDHVEEVYGSDSEISTAVRRFLDPE